MSKGLCAVSRRSPFEGDQSLHSLITEGHGCRNWITVDERTAITRAINEAVIEDVHSTNTGCFAMLSLAQNLW